MNKLLYFILVLFLLIVTLRGALSEVIPLNESQLPYEGSTNILLNINNLNLTSNPPYTIYLNTISKDGNITLNYPLETYFNDTNLKNITVYYSILKFYPQENITNISAVLNLTNNYNNDSASYSLVFPILKETYYFNSSNFYDLRVLGGGYNITVSNDMLPLNGTINYEIIGNPNEYVNISNCGEWLSCPNNFIMPSNSTILNISYFVPYNTAVGFYEKNFTVIQGNVTKYGRVYFNIIEPDILLKRYVWSDDCFLGNESIKMECWEDYENFNQERNYAVWKRALEQARKNITVEIPVEKLVMTGSIDGELKSLYDNCVIDKTSCNQEFNSCSSQNTVLLSEKSLFDKRLQDMDDNIKQKENNINATLELMQKESKDKIHKWYWIGAGILLFIALCTFTIYRWRNNNPHQSGFFS